jgi:cytochrome c556
MRYRLALIVIIQCFFVVPLMCRGTAGETADTRESVQRTEAERNFVLNQMRLFLASIAEIEEALGSGDMDQVAREAAARGRKANAALARPPALSAKESDAWKSMIGSVRSGFDQIAEEATARAPAAKINKTLADTMRNCVACHQTYRISVEAR